MASLLVPTLLLGCGGGVPAWVRNRPATTTFDPTGTWYKVGRELTRGSEYQGTIEIAPHRDQWFVVRNAGDPSPHTLMVLDGNRAYLVLPGNALYVGTETERGIESLWGTPDGPLGYARTGPMPGERYTQGQFADAVEAQFHASRLVDAWTGSGHHERGISEVHTLARTIGGQPVYRWVIDWGNLGRSVGYGWMVGDHLAFTVGTLTHRTSWFEEHGGGWRTLHVRTQLDPTTVALGTWEAETPDRMWGRAIMTGTAAGAPQLEFLEMLSRTPITLDDFHAAACAHGSIVDCDASHPSAPRTVELASELGTCLTVRDGGTENFTPVEIMPCAGVPDQTWTMAGREIRSALGRCLDVNAASTVNGARVQLYDCNGTVAQQWLLDGVTLRSALGTCLDVSAANPEPGTTVQSWECNGTVAQRWVARPHE